MHQGCEGEPALDSPRALIAARAAFLQQIRSFFCDRGVLEVDTPILSPYFVSDPYIDPLQVQDGRSLHSSPEFYMKRLLAAGSGSIFQLCKCFRADERSALHENEFTMLEWYRCDFSLPQLLAETSQLIQLLLKRGNETLEPKIVSYSDLFQRELGFCPHTTKGDDLRQTLGNRLPGTLSLAAEQSLSDVDCLDLLFSQLIQPTLLELSFVTDYPVSMSALAKTSVDNHGQLVAARFEVFYRGIELANAYDELLDADVYLQRHQQDNQRRKVLAKPEQALDVGFVAAMQQGLPNCAGIALGVDRLFMLSQNLDRIDQGLAMAPEYL